MASSGLSWTLLDLPKGKSVAVVVPDGWVEANLDKYNCIHVAQTPVMDSLKNEGVKHFRLHVDMHCRCMGCIKTVEKTMASIGNFSGVETSVADVDTGVVTVVGKVNPTELCHWLKRKTKKEVKIVDPDPLVENQKQKMILVLGSSSKTGDTTPSAPPLQDQMSWALPPGAQSYHENLQLIVGKIRDLEKVRDMLKIKNLENELVAVNCELKHSRKVINSSKKALLDSALNQLEAYKKLEALSSGTM